MRSELPAAFPLLLLIAGLAGGPLLVNPGATMWGLAAIAVLLLFCSEDHRECPLPACGERVAEGRVRGGSRDERARAPLLLLFLFAGVTLAQREETRTWREREAFEALHPGRFVRIEAPIERDWAPRDGALVLRASRFTANGIPFEQPIAIYARFEPPPVAMHATLSVEALLRRTPHAGYAATVKSPRLLDLHGSVPPWHPASWNRMLAARLARYATGHPDEVALAEALVLGRGERLSEEMRESFRRGGTYHLLVFSGLQIALAAGALAALLRFVHAPRAADWFLLGFALLAPPFIGPTASVSRASVAIALYALSRIARRPTSVANLWCVAALLRLAAVPSDLTDPSFHLTYAGAGALLFLGRSWDPKERPNKAVATLRFAGGVEIAIAPLTLFHFHQVTIGGSIVTLAMSPLIFAMLVVSIAAFAIPAGIVLDAIGALHRLCGVLNAAGLSSVFAAPPLEAMLAGGFGALLALSLLRGERRSVAIALALLIPIMAATVRWHQRARLDQPRVTFFDVGQGDAVAIRSGRRTIVVDGGRDRRIVPLLADRGVRRPDLVLLTHAHPDHCEGLAAVVSELGAGAVAVSPHRFRGECASRVIEVCRRTGTPLLLLRDGQRFRFDDVTLEVALAGLRFRRAPENNSSVVVRAITGGRRFLLTGDIEREAELALADRDLRSDVLKVAHHGSRGSTSPDLLEAVAPRLAVISCGRANPFGHPHPSVLGRLRDSGIRTWRTDRDGTIDVDVRDGKLYAGASVD